jgi:hypothetical protein
MVEGTMIFERELQTYERERQALLEHEGKFVVIKGDELLGVFDTYADALQSGYARWKLESFLVKQIAAVEQVLWFSRDLDASCPT